MATAANVVKLLAPVITLFIAVSPLPNGTSFLYTYSISKSTSFV